MLRPLSLASFMLLLFCLLAAGASASIAVVVGPDVPVDGLSFPEVRKLFLGERQFWTPKLRVVLLIRAPVAPNGCPIAMLPPITLSRARSTSPTG